MKKTYSKPQIEMMTLSTEKCLLLAASSGGSTDESLSRQNEEGEDEAVTQSRFRHLDVWQEEEEDWENGEYW